MLPRAGLGKRLALGAVLLAALCPGLAGAAGFDTPILYTARHQAMGGTAIAYVADPSAGFHNPAGLQGVEGLGLLADFSLILGKVRATGRAWLVRVREALPAASDSVALRIPRMRPRHRPSWDGPHSCAFARRATKSITSRAGGHYLVRSRLFRSGCLPWLSPA